jgi:basic membrane protein A
MKRVLLLALALVIGVSLSAHATPSQFAAPVSAKSFKSCLVLSSNVLYDKSFAEATWNGMLEAKKKLHVTPKYLTSQSATDWAPNLEAAHTQGCDIIFATGFTFADVVKQAAKRHPGQDYAIVDYSYDPPSSVPNVRQMVYQTDQAAFLAGYLSAGMTKTGKIGTFGGQNIPTVTIFMDGFAEGAHYYNHVHHTNVTVLGWNPKTKTGLFTGDFTNEAKGQTTTQNLMGQGADIILPVAGSVGLGTVAAVKAAGRGSVIWVDSDGCKTDPKDCKYYLTTVEKIMTPGAFNTIKDVMKGRFKGGSLYTGTLKNGGVNIAPYHQFASKVPNKLKAEVASLKKQIISGKLNINKWK